MEGCTPAPGAVGQADDGWAQMGQEGKEAATSEAGEGCIELSAGALCIWVWAVGFCVPRCLPHSSALHLS